MAGSKSFTANGAEKSPLSPQTKKFDCVANKSQQLGGTFCHDLSYLAISHLPIFHVVKTDKVWEAATTVAGQKKTKHLISPNVVEGRGLAPCSPVQHSEPQQYTNSATNKLCADNNTSR